MEVVLQQGCSFAKVRKRATFLQDRLHRKLGSKTFFSHSRSLKSTEPLLGKVALADSVEDPLEASPLCSKVALASSAEDPLEASPLCSKVALADSVEDPLEASPLCSKVALADSVEDLP